jgi:hypothetical protein
MTDIVKMDVPLFIRLLELAREDVKQDADLHDVAEALIALSQQGIATMADYDQIVGFMTKQGKDTVSDEDFYNDDIRRFRQIVDLADKGETTEYSNTPKEEYSGIDSVTTLAGGGPNKPKHADDIRGNSFRIFRSN